MTATLTPAENALLTAELTRLESALATLNTGAVADYLLARFPTLHAVDGIDTSDHEGPALYIEATYNRDGSDISDEIDPEEVMDHLGNYGVTTDVAEAMAGRTELRAAVAAARALLPGTTCRHCAQAITPDAANDWIHVENEGVYCGLPVNAGDDDTFIAEPTN